MEKYMISVHALLSSYQFIEEVLKMYLERAYNLIRLALDESMPFKFDRRNIESVSLGKLVDMFSQLSDDDELIQRLKRLTPWRNFVAHRAYLMTSDEMGDRAHLDREIEKFDTLLPHVRGCVNRIMEAGRRLDDAIQKLESSPDNKK